MNLEEKALPLKSHLSEAQHASRAAGDSLPATVSQPQWTEPRAKMARPGFEAPPLVGWGGPTRSSGGPPPRLCVCLLFS